MTEKQYEIDALGRRLMKLCREEKSYEEVSITIFATSESGMLLLLTDSPGVKAVVMAATQLESTRALRQRGFTSPPPAES